MNILSRRRFLATGFAAAGSLALGRRNAVAADDVEAHVGQAHREIWRRFIDRHGVMLDFAGLDGAVSIPTPEECRLGKPNALGWWSPIENGGFFNGLYMEAAVTRWHTTQQKEDADKARRLAGGLMLLASISEVKGFVGRGVATDGRAHYPMGSDDQTLPWFYGLWRYLESGLAGADERACIVAKLVETADEILRLKWQAPAEPPFNIRGGFAGFLFYQVPRLLFVAKMMHQVTGDPKWETIYRAALDERGGKERMSRLELGERGMVYDHGSPGSRHSWTTSNCVAVMRGLWEMEKDEALRAAYGRGLKASARVAMESLPDAFKFDRDQRLHFDTDWRKLCATWVPQQTAAEAVKLAEAQSKDLGKLAPRRGQELHWIREPAFAAWIVTLAPDRALLKQRAADVGRVLAHYPYDQLFYSQFFPVELAWWRLRQVI